MNNSSQGDYLNKSRNTIHNEGGSIMISHLKTKIFELEQNEKNYEQLYSKYKKIQTENNQLTENNIQLEYQVRQKTESLSKMISEIKAENTNLKEELSKKQLTNKTLFNNNASLTKAVEEKSKQIDSMTRQISEKELKIAELQNIIYSNNQDNQNKIEQINYLKNENITITNKIKAKEELINSTKEELRDNFEKQKKELNGIISTIQEELSSACSSLNKEKKIRTDCENVTEEMKVEFNKKAEEANQLRNKQEALQLNIKQILSDKEKLLSEIERYKSHVMVLTKSNKELMDEFDEIIIRDEQLKTFLVRNEQLFSVLNPIERNNIIILENNQQDTNGIDKHCIQTSPIHK